MNVAVPVINSRTPSEVSRLDTANHINHWVRQGRRHHTLRKRVCIWKRRIINHCSL